MKQQSIIILVIAFVVVAGGSFYGGMRYGSSKSIKSRSAGGQMMGQGLRVGGGAMGARNGGGLNATNGEITSKDEKSFTVKLADGSSKIVLFSASTTVGEMTQGSMDSLTPGKTVMVMGKTGTDGSITATMVQIRAAGDSGVGGPFGVPPSGERPTGDQAPTAAPAQQ
ncbi:MAG: DUF5666 domain-containing protein [Candidatus Uhrbacteria bacterium]|nr:DUF5666 domain-containing protein [Candidatus Uhrbacteria bacterium]